MKINEVIIFETKVEEASALSYAKQPLRAIGNIGKNLQRGYAGQNRAAGRNVKGQFTKVGAVGNLAHKTGKGAAAVANAPPVSYGKDFVKGAGQELGNTNWGQYLGRDIAGAISRGAANQLGSMATVSHTKYGDDEDKPITGAAAGTTFRGANDVWTKTAKGWVNQKGKFASIPDAQYIEKQLGATPTKLASTPQSQTGTSSTAITATTPAGQQPAAVTQVVKPALKTTIVPPQQPQTKQATPPAVKSKQPATV